jgi:hypothetical protein
MIHCIIRPRLTPLKTLVGKPWFWTAAVALLFGAPFVRGLLAGRAPSPPPVLGRFPSFSVEDDRGRTVSPESLRGRPFIASEVCLQCGAAGPAAAEAMRVLLHRARNLGDALRVVSFVPGGDAQALSALRRQRAASGRWMLLAGDPPPVHAALLEGRAFVLVDAQLRIRGRYEGVSPSNIDEALRDASLLLNAE